MSDAKPEEKSLLDNRIDMLSSVRRFVKPFADRSVEDIEFVMQNVVDSMQAIIAKKSLTSVGGNDGTSTNHDPHRAVNVDQNVPATSRGSGN